MKTTRESGDDIAQLLGEQMRRIAAAVQQSNLPALALKIRGMAQVVEAEIRQQAAK